MGGEEKGQDEQGGTIYIRSNVTCWNIDSMFTNNTGGDAVLNMLYDTYASNINCTYIFNEGMAGAINSRYDFELINRRTRFISNIGEWSGVIYMSFRGTCINIDTSFLDNTASIYGGGLFGYTDVQVINNRSKYIGNTGGAGGIMLWTRGTCRNTDSIFADNYFTFYGGAMYVIYDGSVTNINCTFIENEGGRDGGAIYARFDTYIENIGCRFISNKARYGAVFYFRDGVTCLNIDSIFLKNYAFSGGGVMHLFRGINSSNVRCNFTQNKGNQFGHLRMYYTMKKPACRTSRKSMGYKTP